ncbi:hypothetical protein D3C83_22480 [compost metagenome]
MLVAFPAVSAIEIELEIDGARHRLRYRLRRFPRHERAAEIGVQHRAGQVEDGLQRRPRLALDPRRARAHETGLIESGIGAGERDAQRREFRARRIGHQRAAVKGYEIRDRFKLEQPVE